MNQKFEENSQLTQVTVTETVTNYIFQGVDLANIAIAELWALVESFSFQGQVLLVLVCWLLLNLLAIQICWKVFGPTLLNPKIPGID